MIFVENWEMPFTLNFIRMEKHLVKPKLSVRVQTQQLFDTMFQYTHNAEEEERLRHFLESIKETEGGVYGNGPFSVALADLAYLEEGYRELELLGWLTVPVCVFETDAPPADLSELLGQLVLYNLKPASNQIYIYPKALEF